MPPVNYFPLCLKFTLDWEGGYSDDPEDPGGATNFGITQRAFDRWRLKQGLEQRPVALIMIQEVTSIYEQEYWEPSGCPLLPAKLALALFDACVNLGVSRGVKLLQRCVSAKPDGVFGPATFVAVERVLETRKEEEIVECCLRGRELYYTSLVREKPELRKFLGGWLNRVAALRRKVQHPTLG